MIYSTNSGDFINESAIKSSTIEKFAALFYSHMYKFFYINIINKSSWVGTICNSIKGIQRETKSKGSFKSAMKDYDIDKVLKDAKEIINKDNKNIKNIDFEFILEKFPTPYDIADQYKVHSFMVNNTNDPDEKEFITSKFVEILLMEF